MSQNAAFFFPNLSQGPFPKMTGKGPVEPVLLFKKTINNSNLKFVCMLQVIRFNFHAQHLEYLSDHPCTCKCKYEIMVIKSRGRENEGLCLSYICHRYHMIYLPTIFGMIFQAS